MKNSIKKITLALLLATIITPNAWGATSNDTCNKSQHEEYDNLDNEYNNLDIWEKTAMKSLLEALMLLKAFCCRP